jgi:hypothetical protein
MYTFAILAALEGITALKIRIKKLLSAEHKLKATNTGQLTIVGNVFDNMLHRYQNLSM